MKVYKEVPWYWYTAMFVVCIAMALATSYTAHSGLPWWALFVAVIFATIFVPIIGSVRTVFLMPYKEAIADNFFDISSIVRLVTLQVSNTLFRCLAVRLFLENQSQTW
jgi:membrane-associated HD superfamily phosphohydrolase